MLILCSGFTHNNFCVLNDFVFGEYFSDMLIMYVENLLTYLMNGISSLRFILCFPLVALKSLLLSLKLLLYL